MTWKFWKWVKETRALRKQVEELTGDRDQWQARADILEDQLEDHEPEVMRLRDGCNSLEADLMRTRKELEQVRAEPPRPKCPTVYFSDTEAKMILALVEPNNRLWQWIQQTVWAIREKSIDSLTAPLCTRPEYQRGYTSALDDLLSTLNSAWDEAQRAAHRQEQP